jgi:hypothetical protein
MWIDDYQVFAGVSCECVQESYRDNRLSSKILVVFLENRKR